MIYDPVDVRISVSTKRQVLVEVGGGGGVRTPGPTPGIRHSLEAQDKDLGASLQTLLIGVRFHLR